MIYKELGATGEQIPEIGTGPYAYQSGPEPLRRGLESGALFPAKHTRSGRLTHRQRIE